MLAVRPPAARMGGRVLLASAVAGPTSLVSSASAAALALSLRRFSATHALRVPCANHGFLHPSRPCLADAEPPTFPLPTQRLHGTVTAFKHRRGYGFVLAEGVATPSKPRPPHAAHGKATYVPLAPAEPTTAAAPSEAAATATNAADVEAALHQTYFFRRADLNGGFYVTEGERVSFAVVPSADARAKRAAPTRSIAGDGAADVFGLGDEAEPDPAGASTHCKAADVAYYDVKTGNETPITPITLRGVVVEYDAGDGHGVLAELDTRKQLHDDAPRFPFGMEQLDLGVGRDVSVGSYVRFCLEPAEESGAGASRLVPNRITRDSRAEQRRGANGRPLVPAGAAPGSVTARTRFHGVVREVRTSFGFIVDDLSGESIFFHCSNAQSRIRSGDRVTYLLRELVHGKHAGKKGCFDVQLDRDGAQSAASGGAPTSTSSAPSARPATSAASPPSHVLDFDLLD